MAGSTTAWITLATAAAVAAACAAPHALRPGDPAPQWHAKADSSSTELLWLLRARDVYVCRSAAFALRRLEATGVGVPLQVIGVESDAHLIESFVRAQRLQAEVTGLRTREYRRHFGRTDLPALILIRNGRITHVWTSAAGVSAATDGEMTEIQRALGRRG